MQSRGSATRAVGWVQSSAMLVRRDAAAEVGYLDPEFFVYSDETDFCKRLGDAGWRVLYVRRRAPFITTSSRPIRWLEPAAPWSSIATATCTCESTTAPRGGARARADGMVLRRPRRAAPLLGGDSAPWYLLHARQALRPTGARNPGGGGGLQQRECERRDAPPRSSSRASVS